MMNGSEVKLPELKFPHLVIMPTENGEYAVDVYGTKKELTDMASYLVREVISAIQNSENNAE